MMLAIGTPPTFHLGQVFVEGETYEINDPVDASETWIYDMSRMSHILQHHYVLANFELIVTLWLAIEYPQLQDFRSSSKNTLMPGPDPFMSR
jgi:hypothetical protein